MSAQANVAIDFQHVDIIFGQDTAQAVALLDAGKSRDEILAATGRVVGVADASLQVASGEICVLMGLSGSGKSTLLRAVNQLNTIARGKVLVRHKDEMIDVASCKPEVLRDIRAHAASGSASRRIGSGPTLARIKATPSASSTSHAVGPHSSA